jgi:hypothetical protein
MNAASDDDEQRPFALIAGEIDGAIDEGLEIIEAFRVDDAPTAPPRLVRDADPSEQ